MKITMLRRLNPVGSIMLMVTAVLVFGVFTVMLVLYNPDCFGIQTTGYMIDEVYEFNDFTYETEQFKLSIPNKGWLVPGYLKDDVYGVALLGTGSFSIKNQAPLEGSFDSAFLNVNPEIYQAFRDGLVLEQSYNSQAISFAQKVFQESLLNSSLLLDIFNIKRLYPPAQQAAMSGYIKLPDGSIIPLKENITDEQPGRNSSDILNKSLIVLGLIIMIVIVSSCIYILTVDVIHQGKSVYDTMACFMVKPYLTLPALCLVYVFVLLISKKSGLRYIEQTGFIALSVLAFIASMRKKRRYVKFLFTWKGFASGGFLGLGLSAISLFLVSMGLPKSMMPFTVKGGLFALIYCLSREFLLRGIIQTHIESRLSGVAGLFLTPLLLGLSSLIVLLLTGNMGQTALIQAVVVTPLTAFIPGYLFYRTRSLVAGTVFCTVVDYLPPLLIF
jgi:hypothetical protein